MRKLVWLLLIAIFTAAGWFAWALLTPVEPAGQTIVMLRPGFSTRRIAAELKNAGVIRSQEAFILWHYYHRGRSLKAGEYLFDKPANIIDIQKRLRRGDVYFHTVVVPEGFTMFDIARAIEDAGLGPADEFLKVAKADTSLDRRHRPQRTVTGGISLSRDLRILPLDVDGGDGCCHGLPVPRGGAKGRADYPGTWSNWH